MIFTTHDKQIAYYHAPKTGSRTVLGLISLAKEPGLYETHPEYFEERNDNVYTQLRSRATIHELSNHDWAPDLVPTVTDSRYTFCIVRDPVERFLSGYRNRVLFHKELQGNPSIDQFISNWRQYSKERTIKTHFKPQVCFYGLNKDKFTHVFRLNEMHLVRELFEDVYKIKIPEIRLQQGGNDINIELSKAQIKWIQEKYQDDYNAGWC